MHKYFLIFGFVSQSKRAVTNLTNKNPNLDDDDKHPVLEPSVMSVKNQSIKINIVLM